ncbi:MAG: hypothetical protein F6K16_15450 [Symploca sp. SIO2B6]|nr:hypothetical protein [Symploca sp. SIO2B6]
MGRWGDGEMGGWGDGENFCIQIPPTFPTLPHSSSSFHTSLYSRCKDVRHLTR